MMRFRLSVRLHRPVLLRVKTGKDEGKMKRGRKHGLMRQAERAGQSILSSKRAHKEKERSELSPLQTSTTIIHARAPRGVGERDTRVSSVPVDE